MLASKIADFPKLWPSKRPSKFYLLSASIFLSILGPSWLPTWGHFGSQDGSSKVWRAAPHESRAALDTKLLMKTIQKPFDVDFLDNLLSFVVYFGHVFGSKTMGGGTPLGGFNSMMLIVMIEIIVIIAITLIF